jgi:AcrR family transcriptional regulator
MNKGSNMKNMREKILTVATLLFETRGIHASGVDTIIAESGVAKATLYKYFPSKNELIIEYLKEKSNRFYAWINEKLADKKGNSKEVLFELCNLYEQWISTPEFNGLPFHIGSVEFPDPSHPVHHYSVELSNELQQYLSKLAEIAGVKDAQTLGQQLTIIFEGGALIERLSPGAGAAKRARNAAITLIKASV